LELIKIVYKGHEIPFDNDVGSLKNPFENDDSAYAYTCILKRIS